MRLELVGIDARVTAHHVGGQSLAELLVIDTDHRDLADAGVRVEDLLDLERVDVLPPDTIISSSRPTT